MNYIRLFKFCQYALDANQKDEFLWQFKKVCHIAERDLKGWDFTTFENMLCSLWNSYQSKFKEAA